MNSISLRDSDTTFPESVPAYVSKNLIPTLLFGTILAIVIHGVWIFPFVNGKVLYAAVVLGISGTLFLYFGLYQTIRWTFSQKQFLLMSAFLAIYALQALHGLVRGNPVIYVIGDLFKALIIFIAYIGTAQMTTEQLKQGFAVGILFTFVGILLKGLAFPTTGLTAIGTNVYPLIPAVLLLRVSWLQRTSCQVVILSVFIAASILTLSRLVWVGVGFISVGALLFLLRREKLTDFTPKPTGAIVLSTILTPMCLLVIFPDIAAHVLAEIRATVSLGPSIQGRIIESQLVFSAWQQNPVTGSGLGGIVRPNATFAQLFAEYTVSSQFHFIHNGYLSVLFRTGIFGLILFLALVFRCIAIGIWAANNDGLTGLSSVVTIFFTFSLLALLITPLFLGAGFLLFGGIIFGIVDVLDKSRNTDMMHNE